MAAEPHYFTLDDSGDKFLLDDSEDAFITMEVSNMPPAAPPPVTSPVPSAVASPTSYHVTVNG